jgi:hypothetical protein
MVDRDLGIEAGDEGASSAPNSDGELQQATPNTPAQPSRIPKLIKTERFMLEGALPANPELELARAAVVLVVVDGDAVIQPQRSDRQI